MWKKILKGDINLHRMIHCPSKTMYRFFFSRIRKKRRKEKNRKSLTGYWLMGGETREVKVCEMKQKKNIWHFESFFILCVVVMVRWWWKQNEKLFCFIKLQPDSVPTPPSSNWIHFNNEKKVSFYLFIFFFFVENLLQF